MALSVGPTDVPRVRDRIAEYVTHPSGHLPVLFATHDGPLMFPSNPAVSGRPARQWSIVEYVDKLRVWLHVAELFYVTSEMTDVVRAAGEAMPLYDLHPDSLPADVGLVVFGQPVCVVDDTAPGMEPGARCEIQAALWARIEECGDGGGPGVLLVTWQDCDVMLSSRAAYMEPDVAAFARRVSGPLSYHEEYPLPYGNRPYGVTEASRANAAVSAALTTWIMMGQRITTETPAPVPRAQRRRDEKAGRPTPKVRVVTLRRATPKRSGDLPPGGEPSRTYTHQWVVRGYGYWRNTWYAKTQEHRLQFVHVPAYMKGPEGAPVLGGERVNVLRR